MAGDVGGSAGEAVIVILLVPFSYPRVSPPDIAVLFRRTGSSRVTSSSR